MGQVSHLKGSESISTDTGSQIYLVALSSNLILDPFKLRQLGVYLPLKWVFCFYYFESIG